MTEFGPRRFSIRLPRPLWLFLGTVAFVGVAVGIRFGLPVYRQQLAIRGVERLGGMVETREGGPDWLRRVVGDEWMTLFDEVELVDLAGTQVTDAGLVYLKGLTALQNLSLGGTQVTDAGLVHLRGLPALKTLYLYRTQVSDAGLANLKGLKSLRHLVLAHTKVTAEGVAELHATLPELFIVYGGH